MKSESGCSAVQLTAGLGVGGCQRCGCTGLHACTGKLILQWTEEEKAQLSDALQKFVSSQQPLGEQFATILNENLWDLYEQ